MLYGEPITPLYTAQPAEYRLRVHGTGPHIT